MYTYFFLCVFIPFDVYLCLFISFCFFLFLFTSFYFCLLLFISFYFFLFLFISFYFFLFLFISLFWRKKKNMILKCVFLIFGSSNHVVTNLLQPAPPLSLADWSISEPLPIITNHWFPAKTIWKIPTHTFILIYPYIIINRHYVSRVDHHKPGSIVIVNQHQSAMSGIVTNGYH